MHVRVDRPMAFDIEAWSDYGVAIVGGSAALVGLLFVAVSLNSVWFSSSKEHRGWAGQALMLFVIPLVTSILLVIPGQSTTVLGIEIAVFGLRGGRGRVGVSAEPPEGESRALVVMNGSA